MFPEIPADLSTLTDEELTTLLDELVASFNASSETAVSDDDVAVLRELADGVDHVRSEVTAREDAAAARETELADLASRVNPAAETVPDPPAEADPPAEVPDPEVEPATAAEPAAEAIAAGGNRPRVPLADLVARRAARLAPRPEAPAGRVTITASADIPGVPMGGEVRDIRQLAEMLLTRKSHLGYSAVTDERVSVATFRLPIDESRRLSSDDTPGETARRINQFSTEPDALYAAGGLCAPTEGYYDQLVVAEAIRPVRDALPNFGADRGGIRFNAPPKLADITSGAGIVTAAQDLAGGAGGTKTAFTVTCKAITEVVVSAIYNQLRFGNFEARTAPETVEAWVKTAAALQARTAEQALLDGIAAASTAVTAAGLVGAGREIIARIAQAAAGYRNRNRMDPVAPLTVLLPAWARGLIRADFTRSIADDADLISVADSIISSWFANAHVVVSWYVDTKTGGGQVFGAQAAGVLNQFPSTLRAYVFAPGSFIHLDAGMLDLGLVRDSTLISTNDFIMFTEVFENVAFVGQESLEVSMTLCPDGSYGAAKSVTCPIVT